MSEMPKGLEPEEQSAWRQADGLGDFPGAGAMLARLHTIAALRAKLAKVLHCIHPSESDLDWLERATQRHTGGVDAWWKDNRDKLTYREFAEVVATLWEAGRSECTALKGMAERKDAAPDYREEERDGEWWGYFDAFGVMHSGESQEEAEKNTIDLLKSHFENLIELLREHGAKNVVMFPEVSDE